MSDSLTPDDTRYCRLRDITLKLAPREYTQLIRFGVVGGLGFILDTSVLYASLYLLGFGYYLGRLISYLCASTITWYLHRIFTFRVTHTLGSFRELVHFQLVNSIGGGANYVVYAILIANYEKFREYPVMAVALGALVGMFINYYLSKKVVFRV